MKKYIYFDQEGTHIISEKEILDLYFEYWSNRLRLIGKEDLINPDRCIEDFCVVNWAVEYDTNN